MAGRPQRSQRQIAEQRETRVRLSSPREAARFVEVVRGYGFPAYADGARAIAYAPREELRWALHATRGLTMPDRFGPQRDPQRKRSRLTARQRAFISQKISILRREGRPQAQAIAIAHSMAGAPRRRSSTRRDVSLESIYALADRAKDPASRAVLHDALLERYPTVYKSYIRLAEHPKGRAQLVGRGRRVAVVSGGAYGGRSLVLFRPDVLIDAERRFREPAKRGRRPAAENADYWISEAFDVVSEKIPRPRDAIVVYTSKRTSPNRLREVVAKLDEDELGALALLNPEMAALESRLRRARVAALARRDVDRDAPRTYPIAPGFRLALRPYPFGKGGRELEWVVTRQDRPSLVFASGEASDVADAQRQALRRIPGAATRNSLRRLVGRNGRS